MGDPRRKDGFPVPFQAARTEKAYVVRAFVDVWRKPPEVVTAYKTSKVEKYWRSDA